MFHIVLHQPEIPGNTGNAIRLAANTGSRLHLIHPLGFEMDSARVKRAGLDYHQLAHVREHSDLETCLAELGEARVWVFSRHGTTRYDQAAMQAGDALLFGSETQGLPAAVREAFPAGQQLYLPLVPGNRSMNLSNALAAGIYEAWRQNGFGGAE